MIGRMIGQSGSVRGDYDTYEADEAESRFFRKAGLLAGVAVLASTVVLLLLFGVRAARAGEAKDKAAGEEKPAEAAPAEVPEPVVPERRLEFELVDEPVRLQVRPPGEDVSDLRYQVAIRLVIRKSGIAALKMSSEMRPLVPRKWVTDIHWTDQDWVDVLVANMPESRRPPNDVLADLRRSLSLRTDRPRFFLGLANPAAYARARPLEGFPELAREVPKELALGCHLFAPTVDRGKEMARQLLNILDYGASALKQRECLRKKARYEAMLVQKRTELAAKNNERAELQAKLQEMEAYADLDKQALAQLTHQQRLVAVDMAGVQARIDACHSMLERLKGSKAESQREQVETLKIAAEIELVGLTARRQALDQLVAQGKARAELVVADEEIRRAVDSVERSASETEQTVAAYEALRKANEPFPLDGKILINPVQPIQY